MGFRFRKSFKIAPGIKLNLNKKSTGITLGGKGFHYTANSKGKRTTSIGIPGTGLSYSTTNNKKSKDDYFMSNNYEEITTETKTKNSKKKKGCLTSIILCFLFIIGIGSCGGDASDTEESTSVTTTASAIDSTDLSSTTLAYINTTSTEEETTTGNKTTSQKETTVQKTTTTKKDTTTKNVATTKKKVETTKRDTADDQFNGRTVYITPKGKRYHYDPDCGGKNAYEVSINSVGGRTPCQKCAQ